MKTFETPAGKEIQLIREQKTHHIKIQFGSGGEIPEELSGVFNSQIAAEKAVNIYLSHRKQK